jgi:hypothetical protein
MKIFRGNTPVVVKKVTAYDVYGQPSAITTTSTMVCVLEFLDNTTQTPLRQEMSASHGRIDGTVSKVLLLFAPNDTVHIDDVVDLFGVSLVVDGIWPQQNTMGKIRHLRVQLHHKELASG